MKNYKKVLALLLAGTMTMGTSVVAFAGGSEGSGSGSGELEGLANASKIYDVVLPTVTDETFNFILDPEGLIKATNSERYGDDVTFADGKNLFFKHVTEKTPAGAGTDGVLGTEDDVPAVYETKYDNTSDLLTITNKSSTEVKVDVKATVTGLDTKVAFVDAENKYTGTAATDTAAAVLGDAQLYLALVDKEQTAHTIPIQTTGNGDAAVTEAVLPQITLKDASSEYEVKWNESKGKYEKVLKDTPEESKFTKYQFQLIGSCNSLGDWQGLENIQPQLDVVWKVSVDYDTQVGPQMNVDSNGKITITGFTATENYQSLDIKVDGGSRPISGNGITWDRNNYSDETGGDLIIQYPATWVADMKKAGNTMVVTLTLTDGSVITAQRTFTE